MRSNSDRFVNVFLLDLFMKKRFLILISIFFFTNKLYSFDLFNTNPSLFGIKIGDTTQEYHNKNCLITSNIYGGFENVSDKFDKYLAKVKIDTNRLFEGIKIQGLNCVDPKEKNPDFFNYSIRAYPETLEIHTVSAIGKTAYRIWELCAEDAVIYMTALLKSKKKDGFRYKGDFLPPKYIYHDFVYPKYIKTISKGAKKFNIRTFCTFNGTDRIPNAFNQGAGPAKDDFVLLTISIQGYDEKRDLIEIKNIKKKKLENTNINKKGL